MNRTASWLGASTRPFVGFQLGGLIRYALYGIALVAALMFYVWSRVDVRASAAALEAARWTSADLQDDGQRLRLELASRHDLARLTSTGEAMGLVTDLPVVEVRVQ